MAVKRKKTTSKKKVLKKKRGISSEISPVHKLPTVISALFYGRTNTGKTTVASTFPGPALLLDVKEQGTDSVSDVKDLDIIKIHTWEKFKEVYWYLKDEDHNYKTVIVDPISNIQEMAINFVMGSSKSDDDMISRRVYGKASNLMKQWVVNYRDLTEDGINVVFTAQQRVNDTDEDEAEDEGIDPFVGPALMPSVANVLNGAVKVIGHTFIREKRIKKPKKPTQRVPEYCMRIGPHAYFITKIRQPKSSKVPDVVVNPTYQAIVSLMKGK